MIERWPASNEVNAAVAARLTGLLDEHGGLVAEVAGRTMQTGSGILSGQPHSFVSVLVAGACLAAGADWRTALWPAAGAECMMAAADLFDDVADGDQAGELADPPGIILTAAAGILGLAGAAIVRVVEDGVAPTTAVALVHLFGAQFAQAANGQAANLQPDQGRDALSAFRQATAKSGPLGSLISRLGARTATENAEIVDLLGEFGQRLAVRSQLLNDARDVTPGGALTKADVRKGAHTVPLAFAHSTGAPAGLDEVELVQWEVAERDRVAAAGGLAAARALAEAERLGAAAALDALERLGCPVAGLRELL